MIPVPLPDELVVADAALHALLEKIRFSAHLNPVNIREARDSFLRGAESPPFIHAPATWADDAVEVLDSLRIPRAHPLGLELCSIVDETRALILALRDRTAERFQALAELCDWIPEPAEEIPDPPPLAPLWAEIPAEDLCSALRD